MPSRQLSNLNECRDCTAKRPALATKMLNLGHVCVEIAWCAGNLGSSNFHDLGGQDWSTEPPQRVRARQGSSPSGWRTGLAKSTAISLT